VELAKDLNGYKKKNKLDYPGLSLNHPVGAFLRLVYSHGIHLKPNNMISRSKVNKAGKILVPELIISTGKKRCLPST